jgi:hypothetical protein
VDDTGARHEGSNGVCTQIGNDNFAWFATASRLACPSLAPAFAVLRDHASVRRACFRCSGMAPEQHAPQHVVAQHEVVEQCRGGMQSG